MRVFCRKMSGDDDDHAQRRVECRQMGTSIGAVDVDVVRCLSGRWRCRRATSARSASYANCSDGPPARTWRSTLTNYAPSSTPTSNTVLVL